MHLLPQFSGVEHLVFSSWWYRSHPAKSHWMHLHNAAIPSPIDFYNSCFWLQSSPMAIFLPLCCLLVNRKSPRNAIPHLSHSQRICCKHYTLTLGTEYHPDKGVLSDAKIVLLFYFEKSLALTKPISRNWKGSVSGSVIFPNFC